MHSIRDCCLYVGDSKDNCSSAFKCVTMHDGIHANITKPRYMITQCDADNRASSELTEQCDTPLITETSKLGNTGD